MGPSIHPRTIQEVKDKADIVDVISEHIVLKKKGKEFVGICPFHDDSKPSMTVSPAKQFYYCFSCGAGGNSIKFLMEFTRNNFTDVVLSLAKKNDINVINVDGPQQEIYKKQLSRREELYKILRVTKEWFKSQLNNSLGKEAHHYLTSQRNLNIKNINDFELGYAPNSWNDLFNYLSKVEKFPLKLILSAGLVVSKDNTDKVYDRFRNRLIVPIFDMQGRVVAFGGRSLDGQEPKYLNSPETEVFEKGKMLFAFDKASSNIRKRDKAVVVEGYFDVISLHSKGITNSVASLGTALNKYQISQLCRCTDSKNIIINFDSDNAGRLATKRVINEVESLSLHDQINLKILEIKSSKDPDEYLKENTPEDYFNLIDNASFWIDWEIDQIFDNKDLSKSDIFQNVISSLVKLLSKFPQSATRTHYLQKVSERLSMGQARLAIKFEEDLRKQVKGFRWHGRSKKFEQPSEVSQREKNESEIIYYYLHCPEHRLFIREELLKREINIFNTEYIRLVWESISTIEVNNLSANYLDDLKDPNNKQLNNEFTSINLISLLPDHLALNDLEVSNKINTFINPDELFLTTLKNSKHNLLGTLSLLERYKSLKRCRHLIESWGSQRLKTLENCISILIDNSSLEPTDSNKEIEDVFKDLNSDAIKFQELYYLEREHINFLDKQRCGNFSSNQ
ncbi:CHC2 zinc finger:Toprim domain [Prochlorococcus marinus subsp. pastoris str. CCMP1986]|uniref:DNA primase n=1 Tax=Prochlorococcus marinus subsp. pastoris (strain CCMP1986 / NIES-2087 / MED4) TaxID=59919 RepID=Q7V1D6_PROMP|nr:DNA primase [Prochlorococcus marinus]KGF87494.1 DNA primase [Prochlorococcus marinus str. EQPAC1]CAE19398.1 CHC2 zinc finger:Toprim domain [Prochlorococcus marinus subsp. pastoris str. CCMP1986]